MATNRENNSKVNYMAIDIAKKSNAVLVEKADGTCKSFRMNNNAEDLTRLLSYLKGLSGDCKIALEPTGDYHRPIAYQLLTNGFEVVSISSVAAARYREAAFNSWDKNYPKDAYVLLCLLKQGLIQTYYDPLVEGSHELRELSNIYFHITLTRTRVQHVLLTQFLPLYFPEFARYGNATRARWFIRFLQHFTTPQHIRVMSQEEFVKEAGPLVGRKVNKKAFLCELYEAALSSVALPVDIESIAVETFRLQLKLYEELELLS